MKYFIIGLTVLLSLSLTAQERSKDEKWFVQAQFTYNKTSKLVNDTYSQGVSRVTRLDPNQSFALSLNTIGGYFVIPKRLSLGIGLGWEGYFNPHLTTTPLYGDLRFYLTDEESIPFIFLSYGGYLKLGNAFYRGAMLRLGAGYKISLPGNTLIYIAAAITRAGISLTSESYIYSDNSYRYEGVAFTVGFYLY